MRKLIVSEFVSLDGVMQAPGGKDEDTDGGFPHGGWTWPYWHDAIGQTFESFMKDVDTLLLGRRTYVIHADAFAPASPDAPAFTRADGGWRVDVADGQRLYVDGALIVGDAAGGGVITACA